MRNYLLLSIFVLILNSCVKNEKIESGNFIIPIRNNYAINKEKFDAIDSIQTYRIMQDDLSLVIQFREIIDTSINKKEYGEYQTEEDYILHDFWLINARADLVKDYKERSITDLPSVAVKSINRSENGECYAMLSHKDSIFKYVIHFPEYAKGYTRRMNKTNLLLEKRYSYKVVDTIKRKLRIDMIDIGSYNKINKAYKEISIMTRDYNLKNKKKIDEICNSISYK